LAQANKQPPPGVRAQLPTSAKNSSLNSQPVTPIASLHLVMKNVIANFIVCAFAVVSNSAAWADARLPKGLVYLSKVDPTIHQDMRYAGAHNFVGRPIVGYAAAECILSERAAAALKAAQELLAAKQLSLIVWDCYRPVQAVHDFLRWTTDSSASQMKREFFPKTNKNLLFPLGYLTRRSKHSRASTVDLGITPSSLKELPAFDPKAKLVPCTETQGVRFEDGTIDLGTGYDCLDVLANVNAKEVGKVARDNRIYLRDIMRSVGFRPYNKEWWHFELRNEPFPTTEFDFQIHHAE
jgi:D-alanyl-D-alanine dipeptidase